MANFDMAAANALLKELYFGQQPVNTVYMDRPLLAMIPKMEEAVGEYVPVPLRWADSQGRSSTFTNAQGNQTALKASKFLVTLNPDYSLGTISNQTMLAMATDKGSFVRGVTTVVDSAMNSAANSLSSALFRNGSGILSSPTNLTSGVLTLGDPNDVVQFGVGQTLLQVTTTTGAQVGGTSPGYVISRSVANGTITLSTSQGGAAANPTGWTNGAWSTYSVTVQGDQNAKITGLQGWLPSTDPTVGDNFFGIDRSPDPARLAGQRPQGTASESITEAIIDAAILTTREGGSPKHFICSFGSYSALEKELSQRIQYVDVKVADIMFRGIRINGPKGEIQVFPDKDCPAKVGFLLQMDTLKLFSLGATPRIFTYMDSNEFLRVYNQDAAELRCGYYAQLAIDAPGFNAYVPLIA